MNTNKSFQKLNSLKSERTTFNLTEEAAEILELFSNTYEITQKETFSIILEDDELLSKVMKKIQNEEIEISSEKSQKTKVISKGALDKLNELVKYKDYSRDLILEMALRELNSQLTNRNESHKNAKEIIDSQIDEIYQTGKKLKKLLEEDDPIISRWGIIEIIADNLSFAITQELDNGIPIDPDNFSQSA